MSKFEIQVNNAGNWVVLPHVILGCDASGNTTPAIMKRFSGMVFDLVRAGSYNLPLSEFSLPNGDVVELSVSMTTTVAIQAPIRLCVGFFMLEDNAAFNNGEFKIGSVINYQDKIYGGFACNFKVRNSIVTDYTWQSQTSLNFPFAIKSLNFISNTNCFPVIFAVDDSEEFNNSYNVDGGNNAILLTNGIPADWANPTGSESSTRVKVNFSVSGNGAFDFNMPQSYMADIGSTVTLPTYDSVYNNIYEPFGWSIDNADYALGSSFTVPDHNVTANLLYNDKHYSGIVVL